MGILFSRFVAVVVCAKDLDAALLRAKGSSYEFRVVVKTKPDGKDVLSCCVRTSIFVLCDFVATLYRFLVGFNFLSFSWCLVCYPGFGWGGGCLLFLLLAPCSLSQEEVTATELLASTVAVGARVQGAVLFFCSCCCLH